MPENVNRVVKTNDLRKEDYVVEPPTTRVKVGQIVVSVQRKDIWGTVTLSDAERGVVNVRVKLDADWGVERSELTDQEKQDREFEFVVGYLRDKLIKMRDTHASDLLIKIAEDNRTHSQQLTWSNLPGVLRAQALRQHAFWIMGQLPDGVTSVETATGDQLIDAYAKWYRYEVLRRRSPTDPTSRSSSPISNLLDDMDAWARDTIAQEINDWGGVNKNPVLLRAQELTKNNK
jgi:hypothetical protein